MRHNREKSTRLLVVDDDEVASRLLGEVLEEEGHAVDRVHSGREAVEHLEGTFYDLVISDLRMPDLDGLEVLRACRRISPGTLVILITGFGSMESAIEVMKSGAFDFVSKPFREDEIRIVVRRALLQKRLQTENEQYRQELARTYGLGQIVGRGRAMLEVYKTAAMVIPGRSTVLIQGESGTGKELIARAIHYNGPRASKPFVVINCATLTETLLESELFGHIRGAFTGALQNKKGLFEEAEGGTCFLDEIGDMGLSLQAKLLRVLQEREIRRVGSNQPIPVDVRILAATNQPLEARVRAGVFREDLFYRLRVVTMTLPPLRDRREDIPLLAIHFLKKSCTEAEKAISGISPEAMEILSRHDWPGNVRELEHIIERAVVLTPHTVILPEDLSGELRRVRIPEDDLPPLPLMTFDELERRYLLQILQETGGNRSEAARILGIDRRTLYRMARRYGISSIDQEEERSS